MKKAFLCALLAFSLVFAALAPAQASESQDGQTLFQRLFGKTSASQPTQPDDLPEAHAGPDSTPAFAIDFTQPVQFGSFTVYIPEDFSYAGDDYGPAYAGSLSDSCEATITFSIYSSFDFDIYENDIDFLSQIGDLLQSTIEEYSYLLDGVSPETITYQFINIDECAALRAHILSEDASHNLIIVANPREIIIFIVKTRGDDRELALRELTDGILSHMVASEISKQPNATDSASLTQKLGSFTITLPEGTMVYSDTENIFLLDKTGIKLIFLKEYEARSLDARIDFCNDLVQYRYPGGRTKLLSTTPYIAFRVRLQERCATALILSYQEDLALIEIISPDYDDALDVADAILDSVVFSGEEGASDETGVWDDFIPAP